MWPKTSSREQRAVRRLLAIPFVRIGVGPTQYIAFGIWLVIFSQRFPMPWRTAKVLSRHSRSEADQKKSKIGIASPSMVHENSHLHRNGWRIKMCFLSTSILLSHSVHTSPLAERRKKSARSNGIELDGMGAGFMPKSNNEQIDLM